MQAKPVHVSDSDILARVAPPRASEVDANMFLLLKLAICLA